VSAPTFSIAAAVRMGVSVAEATGQNMDSAWVVALPVRSAVAQLNTTWADNAVMKRLTKREWGRETEPIGFALDEAGLP
jgi:hypothetical protein